MSEFPFDPKLLLGHIQDGLVLVDLKGKVLWSNEIFRKMIGRDDEDLRGKDCLGLGVSPFCIDNCPAKTNAPNRSCGVEAHFNVDCRLLPVPGIRVRIVM